MFPSIGISELLILCVIGLAGIGLPATVLVILFMMYHKLKDIDKRLEKTD